MSKFSTRLKELRREHDVSMQKLASYIGMSKSSINMYERGDREPGLKTLEAIADFFNVDIDYLLGKNDVPRLYSFDTIDKIDGCPKNVELSKDDNINKDCAAAAAPLSPKEAREVLVLMGYRYLDDVDKNIIWNKIYKMLQADKYKDTDFTL